MLALRTDLHDILAFGMLSRHTLEILRHKHGVSEGELFSALMQVLREQRAVSTTPCPAPDQLVCRADEHICRHCGEILWKKDAMKHLWQAHDLVVRLRPEEHYTTDVRLAALYREAQAAGTDPAPLVAAWATAEQFRGQFAPAPGAGLGRYLVRRRGYTMLLVGASSLNGQYHRQDLNRDNQRRGFVRCLQGTFLLVPMRA
ncbi:hypothetical protein [Hymenobacter glacieicola]|uniref:C2H2-type domain-containing protein n=1 Tax=Hymenobacter glacieicola TaxID=1562124 RepID=A0ABQ1WVI8_9BACT|nr:hypothetical protein [Hymenobacter glacieicola]GGG46768.1 hypothetical protein GCM10011378_23730 [Hymenobacter glacieicola]